MGAGERRQSGHKQPPQQLPAQAAQGAVLRVHCPPHGGCCDTVIHSPVIQQQKCGMVVAKYESAG